MLNVEDVLIQRMRVESINFGHQYDLQLMSHSPIEFLENGEGFKENKTKNYNCISVGTGPSSSSPC